MGDKWLEVEVALNQRHEQILMKREALLRGTETYFDTQENKAASFISDINKARQRNEQLLRDINRFQSDLQKEASFPETPKFGTLRNNYWAMVKNVFPVWQEELREYQRRHSQSPNNSSRRSPSPNQSRSLQRRTDLQFSPSQADQAAPAPTNSNSTLQDDISNKVRKHKRKTRPTQHDRYQRELDPMQNTDDVRQMQVPEQETEEKPRRRKKHDKRRYLEQDSAQDDGYLRQNMVYNSESNCGDDSMNNLRPVMISDTASEHHERGRRHRRDKTRKERLPRMSSDPGDVSNTVNQTNIDLEDSLDYSNPDDFNIPYRYPGYKQPPSPDVMKEAKVNYATAIESRLSRPSDSGDRRSKSRSSDGSTGHRSSDGSTGHRSQTRDEQDPNISNTGTRRRRRKAKSVTFYGTV